MLLALPAPISGGVSYFGNPVAGLSASKGPGAGGACRAGYGPHEGDGREAGLETVRRVLALHEVPLEINHASRN